MDVPRTTIGRIYVETTRVEVRRMDITLLPGHRNQGLGTRVMNELLRYADALPRQMSLHVEPFNPAKRMYQRTPRPLRVHGARRARLRTCPNVHCACVSQIAAESSSAATVGVQRGTASSEGALLSNWYSRDRESQRSADLLRLPGYLAKSDTI